MRVFLLFLVSLIFSPAIFARSGTNDSVPVSEQNNRYTFDIATPKAAITGIMIVKESDEEIVGSMINEFGVSAIDFSYEKKRNKLKLLNVIGFLDKWYIKRTLKKDLSLALEVLFDMPYKSDKNHEISDSADSCKIVNKKRNLTYTFNRLLILEDDTER